MTVTSFSKDQTTVFKGIAILLIMFHNFFHWINPINGMENEFYFNPEYVINVFQAIKCQPSEIINILFSYLGHYGVQIFIFLSGMGLALSYQSNPKKWGNFMINRLKKLYPLLIIGFIFYFFSRIITDYRLLTFVELRSFFYKFLFIQNYIPNEALSVNGPWWFFGLIFQLYLFFHIIYHLIGKYKEKAFIGICVVSYIFIFLSLYTNMVLPNVYLLSNAVGHFPEFALGVLFAQCKNIKINKLLFFGAAILFCLGNYYKVCFPFTFLCLTYIMVCVYIFLLNLKKKPLCLKKFFMFFGKFSMALFVIHGFYRWQFVVIANNMDNAVSKIFVSILFIINAVIVSLAADYIYKWIVSVIDKNKLKRLINNRKNC